MRSERSTRVLVPDRRVTRRLSDGIARGNARPMTHASWKARLASRTSSTQARQLRPRLRRLVDDVVGARQRAVGVREDEELEVAVAVDARVEPVEDLGQRHRRVDAAQREGRHRLQGDLGDDPQRADRDARREQVLAAVDVDHRRRRAVTRRSARTCAERLRSVTPVPCVAVEIAPAIDCSSMSPRLGIASPCSASAWLRACRRMPASTRTSPLLGSASSSAPMRSRLSSVPSVSTARRERVARPRDAHAAPGRDRALDGAHDLADRGGPLDRRGLAALITGPVGPHARTLA